MLPAANRMRRASDFSSVVRSGARAGGGFLVLHHQPVLSDDAALVGLVVGRPVGNSVVRHRVSRRLRAQLAGRVALLPPGSGTVVRALPACANATSPELGAELDAAIARVTRPNASRGRARA